jgi:uncharacterized membrane protein
MSNNKTPEAQDSSPRLLESAFSRQIIQASASFRHVGPLPPPELIEKYASQISDAGERLMVMAEKEQQFRHEHETYLVKALDRESRENSKAKRRGEFIALFIFIVCTALGTYLLINGHSAIIAGSLLGAPLLTALGSFIYKLRLEHKAAKAQEAAEEAKSKTS